MADTRKEQHVSRPSNASSPSKRSAPSPDDEDYDWDAATRTPLTPGWPDHSGHRCWAIPHPNSPVREVWDAAEEVHRQWFLNLLTNEADSWDRAAEMQSTLRMAASYRARGKALRDLAGRLGRQIDGPHDCVMHTAGTDTPHYAAEGDWTPDG